MKLILKFLFFLFFTLSVLNASELKSDEYVMFVPSIAYDTPSGVIAEVQAFVYEKERLLGLTTVLAASLGLDTNKLGKVEKLRLYARTALFRIDFESGKRFEIRFDDGTIYKMPKTDDGKSEAEIKLTRAPKINRINFEVYHAKYPQKMDKGFALYASEDGVSAIFDIDDTIKESNVLDKKALIANTFLKEYKAVDEIREVFEYAKSMPNASFHYVSASPVQLYPVLRDFFTHEGFPNGSFHLRAATDISDLVPSKKTVMEHKTTQIEKLFGAYPKRKFILVGDSGENDPEIYAAFQKLYTDRVILIAIRNVTNEDKNSARFKELFEDMSKVRIF